MGVRAGHDVHPPRKVPLMIPWILLGKTQVPGDIEELRLMRRGDEFAILLGANSLMNSRLRGSEEALAHLACDRIRGRERPRVLIGGLGMGFTLRAALGALGPGAKVVVAELVPAVVAWANKEMAGIFGDSMSDPRVEIFEGDVAARMRSTAPAWDAILLDVDNGPDGLTRKSNDRLYDLAGLAAARACLRPGGVLAVWSSGPDRNFSARLRRTGFRVEEVATRAHGKSGLKHMIWVATKG